MGRCYSISMQIHNYFVHLANFHHATRHADWVLNKKISKQRNSGVRIDLHMHIRNWPAATPMHPYVQVNASKYDSDLPYAQDERNLAFNEQTTQPGTPIGC
jgi:hypothetical protein